MADDNPLVAFVKGLAGHKCSGRWVSYPKGTTCLDVMRLAQGEPMGRYLPDYQASLARGEHLCTYCQAKLLVGEDGGA